MYTFRSSYANIKSVLRYKIQLISIPMAQVVRLCREHKLFSALAYLFPRALLDFLAPAAELLQAVMHAPPAEARQKEREAYSYKLLIYLRCCFQGRSFPPGIHPALLCNKIVTEIINRCMELQLTARRPNRVT